MKEIILFFLFLLSFQPAIGEILPVFNYFDELIAVISIGLYFLKRTKKRLSKEDIKILVPFIIFIVVGLIGNYKTRVTSSAAILEDAFSFSKMIFVFLFFDEVKISEKRRRALQISLYKFCKALIVVMFACAMITQVYNFGMGHDPRYGFQSFRFVFLNAPALNSFFYFFATLFSLVIFRNENLKKNTTIYVIMLSITWMFTLRSRAIAFALLYFLIYLFVINRPKRIQNLSIKKRHVILGALIAVVIGWSSFLHYFFEDTNQVRYIMSRMGIKLANQYFPVGSGFATFGTEASRKYYSAVYSQLGIANVWGVSKDTGGSFILDQFWFGFLGQFGFLGLLLFAYIMFSLYKRLWRYSKTDKGAQLAVITFIFTTFLGSISAATYIHSYTIASVIVLLLLMPKGKNNVLNV